MDDRESDYQLFTYSQPLEALDLWRRQSMEQIEREYWSKYRQLQNDGVNSGVNHGMVNVFVAKWLAMLESRAANVLNGFCVEWDVHITAQATTALFAVYDKRIPEALDAVHLCRKMFAESLEHNPLPDPKHDVWSDTLQAATRMLGEWIAISTCHNVGRKVNKTSMSALIRAVFTHPGNRDHQFMAQFSLSYKTVCHLANYSLESMEFEEKARKTFGGPLSKEELKTMWQAYTMCARVSPYESIQDRKGHPRPGQKKKRSKNHGEACHEEPSTAAGSTSINIPIAEACVTEQSIAKSNYTTEAPMQQLSTDPVKIHGVHPLYRCNSHEPVKIQRCQSCGIMECNLSLYLNPEHTKHCGVCCNKCMSLVDRATSYMEF